MGEGKGEDTGILGYEDTGILRGKVYCMLYMVYREKMYYVLCITYYGGRGRGKRYLDIKI